MIGSPSTPARRMIQGKGDLKKELYRRRCPSEQQENRNSQSTCHIRIVSAQHFDNVLTRNGFLSLIPHGCYIRHHQHVTREHLHNIQFGVARTMALHGRIII